MNDIELREELLVLNAKLDHIGRITSEIFVITKSYEQYDQKLDICIKSLNNLSYKVDNIERITKTSKILPPPPLPPPPLPPPPLPPPPLHLNHPLPQSVPQSVPQVNNIINMNSNTGSYMEELKIKLEERRKSIE